MRGGTGSSALAVLAGAMQAASLAWPISLSPGWSAIGLERGQTAWWVSWLALAMFAALIDACATPRAAVRVAAGFALAQFGCALAWVFVSLHTYGGMPPAMAVASVLALAAGLAVYQVLVCAWYVRAAPPSPLLRALLLSALWMLAELCRGTLWSGFGWGAVGYAQIDGPLAPWIPWVGVYGTGALAVAIAALSARLLAARTWQTVGASPMSMLTLLLALCIAPYLADMPSTQSAGELSVRLLQGNIPQDEKFDARRGIPQSLQWYAAALFRSPAALTLTPETAIPVLPRRLPPGYWRELADHYAQTQRVALVGITLGDMEAGYTNSVVALGMPWQYDKHHLVPFGEFTPVPFAWFREMLHIPYGDFERGPLPQPPLTYQGQRIAASICYETLFPEEMAASFSHAARAPTILANLSNLGWFGEHLAMDQHLHIARVRAREFARPLLLVTNTGRTVVIDHTGHVRHAAAPHTATVLDATVQGRTGLTPYAWWMGQWGLLPLWVLGLLGMLAPGLRALPMHQKRDSA
ncbi:apolipoprotein N-acyltransferase [Candidatus Symbiobacter mobilis CR]|uniref:Apolipoprotein N-acyltransferase n=2 Tax=Candidatus Symbiobacter TaxID=1436289 RepID=U5N952_9BURK|nr:apolipoprotein N-acyltransferase [Candidatus Symbiobacter mobilis CR]